ncbi:MAG: MBL fold metallo-hydrolase [Thermoleophilia bacterium]|nr:MBL fold metallo-hydrolase [Thermoleophilia bacterium]
MTCSSSDDESPRTSGGAVAEVIQYTLGMSNGFFVKDRGIIAVDSGSELGREHFLSACKECGIEPEQIKLLVVTHGHVDHFVNVGEMKAVTGAPIMCHKGAERNLREAIYPDVRPRNRLGDWLLSQADPDEEPVPVVYPIEPDIVVEGMVDLRPWGIDGRLVETFGHSLSCMSLLLDSGQAIVGDLLVVDPRDGTASLAYFSYSDDQSVADRQVFASVSYLLDNAELFYCGHGGPFTRDEIIEALAAAKAEADEDRVRLGRRESD